MSAAVDRVLAALESHGCKPKRSGKGWVSRCAGHDDSRGSLALNEASDGRALLICRAGCETPDVVSALGLEMRDLMSDDGRPPSAKPEPAWGLARVPRGDAMPSCELPRLGAPVGLWVYRDASGWPLGIVARYARPDGGKEVRPWTYGAENGGRPEWAPHTWPRPRPPYGLDRLAAKPDALAMVTEGEKAADAAEALLGDVVAVTSPGGASAADCADWSPLAGRRVVVWPDADPPGAKYAADVARLALEAGAASVAVVELPAGLPKGWDLADALPDGWTVETVRELLAAAKPAEARAGERLEVVSEPAALAPERPEDLGAEAYHGPAGDFVRAVEPNTEAHPVALLLSFLLAVGSAIGPRPRFRVGGDEHTARLNAVLVGETSHGRKGTSWGWPRAVVGQADPSWLERVAGGLSSGEGLVWAVRDKIEKYVTPKRSKTDPNPEPELVTVDPGVDDKRLMVVEGEFASTLRVAERDGSTLSATIRNAWDLGPSGVLQSLVKNSPGKATGAHISILGHVTAAELRRYLTSTEAGNGYGNRILWLAVWRSKLLPDGGSLRPEDLTAFSRDLGDRIERARTLGELRRSPEAAALWREVYPLLSRDEPGLFGAVTARAEAQVLRLSLLYALLDVSPEIRPEHLAAALEVWRYAEDSARYVFGDATGDPVADEILRALRGAPGGLTRNDLRELFKHNVASGRMGAALDALARAGKATATMEPTAGRPAERWRAIPPASPYAVNAINAERGRP